MNTAPLIHNTVPTVAGRLHTLEIPLAVLREAARVSTTYYLECNDNDPPSMGGISLWGKAVRTLRDQLIPLGWRRSNARNYATVVHPTGAFAIAVAGGDSNTGRTDGDVQPATRTEKGPATKEVIAQNQYAFADEDPSFPDTRLSASSMTWLLLLFVDEVAGETRCELSLPRSMTEEGLVVGWHERIVLPSVPIGVVPTFPERHEDEDVDIDVRRREAR